MACGEASGFGLVVIVRKLVARDLVVWLVARLEAVVIIFEAVAVDVLVVVAIKIIVGATKVIVAIPNVCVVAVVGAMLLVARFGGRLLA